MSIADWWMPWSQNGYECHVCQLQYSLQLQCGLFQNKATVWRSVTSRCISHLTICKFRSFCKLAYTHKLLLCNICRNFNYDDQAPHCCLKTGYGTLASMSLTFTLEKSTFSRCFQIYLLVDCLKAACKLLSDNNVVVKQFFYRTSGDHHGVLVCGTTCKTFTWHIGAETNWPPYCRRLFEFTICYENCDIFSLV